MKKQMMKMTMVFLALAAIVSSCKKDKIEENEEEVITTMILTFTPEGGGPALSYEMDDPDGPGGNDPTQDEIVLAPSQTYNVMLQLLNRTETPAEDMTEEVQAESDAHRFYYVPSAGSNITVSNLNNDGNGIPLGITSVWQTGAAATGTIAITLRHYASEPPNKAADDPVSSSKSSTDISVEFATKIE